MATPRKPVKVAWKGKEVQASMQATSVQNLQIAAVHLKSTIMRTLTGNRSGRVYTVPGSKRRYRASAPGEPPASRFGDLRRAISFRVNKRKREAFVGPRILGEAPPRKQYPLLLELGSPGGKILPRPYMAPSFEIAKARIIRILKDDWDD